MQRPLTFLPSPDDAWEFGSHVLVVAGPPGSRDDALAAVDQRLGQPVSRLVARRNPGNASGTLTLVDVDGEFVHRIAWLPLGEGLDDARRAGAKLAREVTQDAVLVWAHQLGATGHTPAAEVAALLQGWALAGYTYSWKAAQPEPDRRDVGSEDEPGALAVAADPASHREVGSLTHAAVVARDWTNTPSNRKSPQWLAAQVKLRAREAGLTVSVRDERYLERERFGGILAVGRGSARPPRFVEITSPGRRGGKRVVLIGKGVTYDSGGLTLKPAESMAMMKTDMAGAAAAAAALLAYADDPGRNHGAEVIALLPMAENMPSGSAYRPGDVVRHYGGLTTEVSNTDAEGRLLLADALAYAHDRLAPDVVVDIATLTGAATLGLSRHYGALLSSCPALAEQLRDAGAAAGEPLWQLPLVDSYRRYLESPIADVAQASTEPKVRAGAIMAALFLERFTGDVPWAHIDIAGPARADKVRSEHPVGATGFGARLLGHWLRTANFDSLRGDDQ